MTSASGSYVVQYDPKALKELTKLDKPVARRIVKAIDALDADPRRWQWQARSSCGREATD